MNDRQKVLPSCDCANKWKTVCGVCQGMQKDEIIRGLYELDGISAVNLQEPSEGDLKRVHDAYIKALHDFRRAFDLSKKLESDLQKANETIKNQSASLDGYWAVIEEMEKERDQLKADLAEAEKVIGFYGAMGDDDDETLDDALIKAVELRESDKVTINLGGKMVAEKAREYLQKRGKK